MVDNVNALCAFQENHQLVDANLNLEGNNKDVKSNDNQQDNDLNINNNGNSGIRNNIVQFTITSCVFQTIMGLIRNSISYATYYISVMLFFMVL